MGLRDDGWIELGACKWGPVSAPRRELDGLIGRAERFPNPRNSTIGLRLFTGKKTRPVQSEKFVARWHTLADLYDDR